MNVYLIARPTINWDEVARFADDHKLTFKLDSNSDAEMIVEVAGRLCYLSFGKGRRTNKEYLEHLIQMGHFSVLEHANWTLLITGISRACSHEIIRHRHFSFSQLSQRYVDHLSAEFIEPVGLGDLAQEWRDVTKRCQQLYGRLTKLGEETGIPRKVRYGVARSILPNATETKIAVTGNARTWREFIQKRASPEADIEIRDLASKVHQVLSVEAPTLFGGLSGQQQS
jgi:thymidylate synthase (FAD)